MRGEYNTRQKAELVSYLSEHPNQSFSVENVVFALHGQVGRTTVYRTLEQMAESGRARKYRNAAGVTQYQFVSDSNEADAQMHMLCQKCGSLKHVECEFVSELDAHVRSEHGFAIDPAQTVIVGVCNECAGAPKPVVKRKPAVAPKPKPAPEPEPEAPINPIRTELL